MIDSHGNPGIAGSTRGVVVEEDVVTVCVTTAVVLTRDVEIDVLISVVAVLAVVTASDELVEVTLELVELTVELVATDVIDVLPVVGDVVVAVYTVGGLGGSKWIMPDKLPPATGRPTAQPSSGPVRKTDRRDMPGAGFPANIGGARGVLTQETPSQ
jgi:hypothetical protein